MMHRRRFMEVAWLPCAFLALAACGGPLPERPLHVQAPATPSPDIEPAEPVSPTCRLKLQDRAELIWLRGPGGTAVWHPNLNFSFVLPDAGFEPTREERPLMLSAVHDDDRTVSYPFFDDFSRSLLVVRITTLDDQTSLEEYLTSVEADVEEGAKQEFGKDAQIAPWKPSKARRGSGTLIDGRLHVLIRGWPLREQLDGCTVAVVLIGASISPREMYSIVDAFEIG